MTATQRQQLGFRHQALFYADRDEFLAGTVPFVEAGVEAGETVLVALPRPRRLLLQEEVDPGSAQVRFLPMEGLGRNPSHQRRGRGVRAPRAATQPGLRWWASCGPGTRTAG